MTRTQNSRGYFPGTAAASVFWFFAAFPGLQDASATEEPSSYEFRGGHWYNGQSFEQKTVYVQAGRLSFTSSVQATKVVDLDGKYVIPPFGEAHTHRPASPDKVRQDSNLFLEAGIFYVMNHGSIAQYFVQMSESLNTNDTVDAVFANAILSSPQSHSVELWQRLVERGAFPDIDVKDLDGEAYFVIDSARDLARRWHEILSTRPQFIKVMLQYSEEYDRRRYDSEFFGSSGLDPTLIPDIVARAHGAGLRVSAHIETAADFRLAVEAGVDIVAHLPGYDIKIDDDISRYQLTRGDAHAAAARDIIVLTTTLLSRDRAEDQPRKLSRMLGNHETNLRLLAEAGVRIGVGSDQFSKNSVDELMSLATLNLFDNSALLEMICISTPTAIFPERRIGHLVEGAEANFLVLPGNPLENIAEIRNVEMRVKNGLFLDFRKTPPK